jgi:hypothetical protein
MMMMMMIQTTTTMANILSDGSADKYVTDQPQCRCYERGKLAVAYHMQQEGVFHLHLSSFSPLF